MQLQQLFGFSLSFVDVDQGNWVSKIPHCCSVALHRALCTTLEGRALGENGSSP